MTDRTRIQGRIVWGFLMLGAVLGPTTWLWFLIGTWDVGAAAIAPQVVPIELSDPRLRALARDLERELESSAQKERAAAAAQDRALAQLLVVVNIDARIFEARKIPNDVLGRLNNEAAAQKTAFEEAKAQVQGVRQEIEDRRKQIELSVTADTRERARSILYAIGLAALTRFALLFRHRNSTALGIAIASLLALPMTYLTLLAGAASALFLAHVPLALLQAGCAAVGVGTGVASREAERRVRRWISGNDDGAAPGR